MSSAVGPAKPRGEAAFISPQAQRAAEDAHKELLANAANIQAFFKYLNFDDPVEFDRCLGKSGKSPECLMRSPEGGPKVQHTSTLTSKKHRKAVRKDNELRQAAIEQIRRDVMKLKEGEVMERLEAIFELYCDQMRLSCSGRLEMDVVGFCRLLRDCRLLDNRLNVVQADVIFTQIDARADADSIPGDMWICYSEFLACLRRVIRIKYPHSTDLNGAVLVLARKWILPFQRGATGMSPVDGMFTRGTLTILRKYDTTLKRLFSWYANLDEINMQRLAWPYTRDNALTIGSSEFALMLLNFKVLPVLLSKFEAITIFMDCEARNDADEQADMQLFPAFMETLALVALHVADMLPRRLRDTALSPDQLKFIRRYADSASGPLKAKLEREYAALQKRTSAVGGPASSRAPSAPGSVWSGWSGGASTCASSVLGGSSVFSSRRPSYTSGAGDGEDDEDGSGSGSRDGGEGDPGLPHRSYYEAMGHVSKLREVLLTQQQEWQGLMQVILRREELRNRFALARLRNFYRDVRSIQQMSGSSGWPAEEEGDGGPVHVAFYSDSRPIRTPQAQWIPAGQGPTHHVPQQLQASPSAQQPVQGQGGAPRLLSPGWSGELSSPGRRTSPLLQQQSPSGRLSPRGIVPEQQRSFGASGSRTVAPSPSPGLGKKLSLHKLVVPADDPDDDQGAPRTLQRDTSIHKHRSSHNVLYGSGGLYTQQARERGVSSPGDPSAGRNAPGSPGGAGGTLPPAVPVSLPLKELTAGAPHAVVGSDPAATAAVLLAQQQHQQQQHLQQELALRGYGHRRPNGLQVAVPPTAAAVRAMGPTAMSARGTGWYYPGSPGVMMSPGGRPLHMSVAIEERPEHENIVEFTKKLPALVAAGGSGSGGGSGSDATGRHDPRVMSAPAGAARHPHMPLGTDEVDGGSDGMALRAAGIAAAGGPHHVPVATSAPLNRGRQLNEQLDVYVNLRGAAPALPSGSARERNPPGSVASPAGSGSGRFQLTGNARAGGGAGARKSNGGADGARGPAYLRGGGLGTDSMMFDSKQDLMMQLDQFDGTLLPRVGGSSAAHGFQPWRAAAGGVGRVVA